MLDNIVYGVTGAWNIVIHLIHLLAESFSSGDAADKVNGYGVNREALAHKIYGACAATDDFRRYGPSICLDHRGGLEPGVVTDPDFTSSDPGTGRFLSSDHMGEEARTYGHGQFSSSGVLPDKTK